jgi:hypothetical protein
MGLFCHLVAETGKLFILIGYLFNRVAEEIPSNIKQH